MAALLAGVCAAQTGSLTLTMEGLANQEEILNYYTGGLGSAGSGPGPNYGITFGTGARALISSAAGGTGNFSGNPSGNTAADFVKGGGSVIMNVLRRLYRRGFSFYYANATSGSGAVTLYDGANGTGNILATLLLSPTGSNCNSSQFAYSCWVAEGVSFGGIAESVDFGNAIQVALFDNFTIGSPTPGGALIMNCTGPSGPVTAGTQYSTACALYGGTGIYNWTFAGLPSWLTPSGNSGASITLSGTVPGPPPGSYTFTVMAADSSDLTASQPIAITVTPAMLTMNCTPGTSSVVAGSPYSVSCIASGGTSPLNWAFVGLPSWLQQSGSTGPSITLSGTVPNPPPGSYNITATVTDSALSGPASGPQQASQTITINVTAVPLSLNCNPLTGSVVAGAQYSVTCTYSGGPLTFQGLPSWLTASGTGATVTLTGTAPSPPPGLYSFSASVFDSFTQQSASQTITITVVPKLSISCAGPSGPVVAGTQYSATCTASGGTPAYGWTFAGLPAWLSPSGTSGATVTLAGTVPSPPPSSYSVTATATDSTSQTAVQTIAIAVVSKLNISCIAPGGEVGAGTQYSATCTASGGTPGYNWSFPSLPSWLSPSGNSGATITITGTVPSSGSSFILMATLTDSGRPAQTASQSISITVVPKLNISCTVPSAIAATPFSASCTASGGVPGYSWTFPGLPSWLSPSGNSGAIITLTGTPPFPPPASYGFTATVTDITAPTAQTALQAIAITVAAPRLNVLCSASSGLPAQGTPYLVTCSVSGGTPGYKWTASGAPWLTLSANTGVAITLTGTVPSPPPTSYTLTVTATDSGTPTPQAASQTFTINVSTTSPLRVGCTAPTGAVAPGTQYSALCAVAGGTPGYNWSFSGLPPWLFASGASGSTITLAGTVPSPPPGSYTIGVTVSDSGIPPNAQSTSQTITIVVSSILTVSCVAPSGSIVAGAPYSATCTASGGTPGYGWTFPGLPSWLTPSGTSGGTITLTGTAPSPPPASYSFTASVTDSTTPTAQTASQTIAVAVVSKLNVTCAFLTFVPPSVTAGSQFSDTCQATGGTPGTGYKWTFSGLPSWLSSSGSTGASITLTGTAPSPPPASYSFTVTVTDSTTPAAQTASQSITITVVSPQLNITCTPSSGSVTALTQYSAACSGSGGTPGSGYTWTFSGLPPWLSSNTSTGATITLSGTVPTPPPGSYTVSVTVTDNSTPVKQTATQTITITVAAAPLQLTCTPTSDRGGTVAVLVGGTFTASCTASGGTLAYTYSAANLPSWLTQTIGTGISFAGTVPSPPPASYSFTVSVTDSSTPTKQTASQTISITVAVPPLQGVTITQNSTGSAPNQTNLSFSLPQTAQGTYSATLSLSFKPDPSITNLPANYVDPAAGFPASGQGTTLTQSVSLTSGVTPSSIVFAEGTVAGTWTVTLTALTTGGVSALPSPSPSYTVPVALAAPSITVGSVKIVNATSSGFTVQLTGFATTRDVASGTFVFAAASGAQLQGSTVTVPFNGLDQSEWFNTAAGQSAGGTFSLSLPFAFTGDPNALGTVTVHFDELKIADVDPSDRREMMGGIRATSLALLLANGLCAQKSGLSARDLFYEATATPTAAAHRLGLRYDLLKMDPTTRKAQAVDPDQNFKEGDCFAVEFTPNRSGQLYVFNLGSSGESRALMPSPAMPNETGAVQANVTVRIPREFCFQLDGKRGVETLTVAIAEAGEKESIAQVRGWVGRDLIFEKTAEHAVYAVEAAGNKSGHVALEIRIRHE